MNRNIGRTVEHSAALPFARLALRSDSEYQFAVVRSFLDDVTVVIDEVKVVVGVYLNTVGPHELAMAHPTQEITVGIEHGNRLSAPVEHINVVFRIDGNRCGIAPECHSHRQFGPSCDGLEFRLCSSSIHWWFR